MRHRTRLVVLLFAAIACLGAVAGGPTDAEVRRQIDLLDSPTYTVRRQATETLEGYIRNNRLTPAQLGILRTYPMNPTLELLRRKERILATWTARFPAVGAAIDGVRFENISVICLDWDYRFGPFYGGAGSNDDDPSHGFAVRLYQRYAAARNALLAADTAQAVAALRALRTYVNDNFDQLFLWTDAAHSTVATKQQVLARIDQAITDTQNAIQQIQIGSGNVQPPPRQPRQIQQGGAIDMGRTLKLALLQAPVVGGGLDVFLTPYEFTLAAPPAGYRFAGELFGLTSTDTLDVSGNTITVGLEYGSTDLAGEPIVDPFELRVARLSNGRSEILADSTPDTAGSVVTASYQPSPGSFGADQFGEFVLVRPSAPPPPCTATLACPDGTQVSCKGTMCAVLDLCRVSCDGIQYACKQPPGSMSPCGK